MRTKIQIRYWPIAMTLFISLGMASISSPALAVTVQHYRLKGEAAHADWSKGDGCTFSSVSLSVLENATPNGGNASQFAFLNASTYNFCTMVSSSSTYTNSSDIQFSGQKTTSATLKGTLSTTECTFDPAISPLPTCEDHTVAVDLQWVGNNDVARTTSVTRIQSMNGMSMERISGPQVTATVSGSIIRDDNVSLIDDLQLQFGDIINSTVGQITITRQ